MTVDRDAPKPEEELEPDPEVRGAVAVAFAIGALVGLSLAAIWVPERRRSRVPPAVRRRYRRARTKGATALRGIGDRVGSVTRDLEEEAAATLEAAREELQEIVSAQLERAREAFRR